MDGSGLTEFLLDLTEDEELSRSYGEDPDSVISARGLDQYGDLLKSGNVEQMRKVVRAEIMGQAVGDLIKGVMRPTGDEEPEAIIAGVRIPGVRGPEEPIPGVMESSSGDAMKGVREPPPPDEPIPGVMEPGQPDEGIRGVMEPGPPDEGIRGVMEPGPPESA
jgi:hypothetical protein